MPDAREIMDVYTGSEEDERLDMYLSNRELREQFDALDKIVWKNRQRIQSRTIDTPYGGIRGLWTRLTRHCPWPGHVRGAGAKS